MRTHKIFRSLMAFLLLMSAGQSVTAQEAFYVYRNDGDFNGFFYDQVKRMSMSKIDFDGVEHDDYVIQEIETEDSLYRIPLLAIDSISFIQPEIKFNPRLKNMAGSVTDGFSLKSRTRAAQGECMSDWVTKVEPGYDSYTLYFDKDTPKELVPQEGDVLVDFYDPKYKQYFDEDEDYSGFSGKVVSSIAYSDGTRLVTTESLSSLSDIFVQFVTVEDVVNDEENGMSRRLAGWPEEELHANARGAGTATLVDIDRVLKHDFSVGNGNIGVELGVAMKVRLGVTYNITMSNLFVKAIMVEDFKLKGSVSAKCSGDLEAGLLSLPKPISSIKFPVAAPVFQTKPIPNAFLRVKGEIGAKLDLPTVGFRAKQVMTFDTDDSPMMSSSCDYAGPDGKPQKGIIDGSDLTLYFNGSVQIGAKFSANIETNDWIDAVFHSGISADFYLGPQIDGQIEMKANLADLLTGNAPNIYSSMKESQLNFAGLAANVEVKGKLKIFDDEEDQTFTEVNKKWMEASWFVFPEITSNEVEFDPGKRLVNCKLEVKRPVFLLQYIGLGIYDAEGNLVDKQFSSLPYFLSEQNNQLECSFNVPCGRYWVYPLLRVAGQEIKVDDPKAEKEVIVTPMLYHEVPLKTDTVQIGAAEETIEILFQTDAKELTIGEINPYGLTYEIDENFASVDEWDPNFTVRTLTVKPGKNPGLPPREWKILLKARVGSFETTDTICLIQNPGHPQQVYVKVTLTGPFKITEHKVGNDKDFSWDTTEYSDQETATFEASGICSYAGEIMTLSINETSGDPTPKVEEYNDDWGAHSKTHSKITQCIYTTYTGSMTIDLENLSVLSGNIKRKNHSSYITYMIENISDDWIIEVSSSSIVNAIEEANGLSMIPYIGAYNGGMAFSLNGADGFTFNRNEERLNNETSHDDMSANRTYNNNDNWYLSSSQTRGTAVGIEIYSK